MKRQSLKTVLSAFVFALAIVASFAFKSTPNNIPDEVYIQRLPPEYCDLMTVDLPYGCSINNWGPYCSLDFSGVFYTIFSRRSGILCVDEYRQQL